MTPDLLAQAAAARAKLAAGSRKKRRGKKA